MEDFLEKSTFVLEESHEKCEEPFSTMVDLKALEEHYVSKGKARFIREAALVSVVVKEAYQLDVKTLPCGARSLLVSPTTGEIHVRGVNKFLALSDIGFSFIEDRLWDSFEVFIQRKMAGFCVCLYSGDGETLSVMTKHSISGHHVQIAQRILETSVNSDSQKVMAQDLYRWRATATCECVSIAEDFGHPVLEHERFDNQLILFAVQRNQVAERGLPPPQVTSLARRWGLQAAPLLCVRNSTDLINIIMKVFSSWVPSVPFECADGENVEQLAEGVVIVMRKISPSPITGQSGETNGPLLEWEKLFRLKVKTVKYVLLRNLRSLLLEESQCRCFFIHKIIVEWANSGASPFQINGNIVTFIREKGVWTLWRSFEQFFLREAPDSARPFVNYSSGNRITYRGARWSVGEAYQILVRQTVKEVVQEGMRIENKNNPAPITLVVLCGLPGSGKSTFAGSVLDQLRASLQPSYFGVGVVIHRDVVQSRILQREVGFTSAGDGVDSIVGEALSKHKMRRVKQRVHREIIQTLDKIAQLSYFLEDGEGNSECTNRNGIVVIIDACNSTPSARRVWRDALPSSIDAFIVVHLMCSLESEVEHRLLNRPSHECLRNSLDAQRALYTIKKKFVPPNKTEQKDALFIELDTCNSKVEEFSQQVINRIFKLHKESGLRTMENKGGEKNTIRVLDGSPEEVENEIERWTCPLLHSLLHIDRFSASTVKLFHRLCARGNRSKSEKETIVQLRIEDSQWEGTVKCELFQLLLCALKNAERDSSSTVSQMQCDNNEQSIFSVFASPFYAFRQTICRFLSPCRALTDTSQSPIVISGQTKWLSGWLFGSNNVTQATEASLRSAVNARFSETAEHPHVTLFYAKQSFEGNSNFLQSFLQISHLRIGQHIRGRITDLLIDRNAWSVLVELLTGTESVRRTQWSCDFRDSKERVENEEMGPVPLHVTMGKSEDVKFSYAGSMPFLFQKWENDNVELASAQRLMKAKRSRQKYHNFLHIRLSHPIPFDGVVEVLHDERTI